MRILFVGHGDIAKASLNILLDETPSQTVCGLVCPQTFFDNIKCNTLPKFVLDMNNKNEPKLISLINDCKPDIIFSVQYPWIFSADVIRTMNGKIINLHNAKLPDYRGHHSISYAIINGDRFYTSTLHWVALEVDRGFLIKETSVVVDDNETAHSLWNKTYLSCLNLIKAFFTSVSIVSDIPKGKKIPSGGRFYSKNLINTYKCITKIEDLNSLDLYARAFYFPPYEPAYLNVNGSKVYLVPEYKK